MKIFKKLGLAYLSFLAFWILVFDFQRILFSIHNYPKIADVSSLEWIQVFFHSIRIDLSTGSFLSAVPLLLISCFLCFNKKIFFTLFKAVMFIELVMVAMIHAGEINAYGEWNHKLTSRVFMHLSHPDEVFRTADYSMTLWFMVYFILEFTFGGLILQKFFRIGKFKIKNVPISSKIVLFLPILPLLLGFYFVLGRGGFQQIPLNIDSAYFSKKYVINDIAVNSPYFFGKSFLLYNRSNIGEFLSDYSESEINELLNDFLTYEKKHEHYILENTTPNLVFVILESWTSTVSSKLSGKPGVTEELDKLSEEGVLFTNLYATGSTSEIGNASIFSGYPALPEISISMQPFKHRKLKSINQSIASRGYTSGYLFSGDLKYGNINSYFTDHGFNRVQDESDFPEGLEKGKLNYYDEALFELFLEKLNKQEEPFLEGAFTGSTHSPYDFPGHNKEKWTGKETNFMNSVIYADQCLADFIEEAKQQDWYENTLFVIVADHGHASPYVTNPNDSEMYRIPLLLYGPALKDDAKGMIIDKVGSQADIAQTLMYQMKVDTGDDYPWSKDLLNPNVPEFALHATTRGFGWVTPKGKFTYHLDYQKYIVNTFEKEVLEQERKRCNALMQMVYEEYEDL
ncbi:LTA synthase family protein [Brumimicrobium aurantiacum]|uniref:Alkaline phosphatase family protein n=1 Tax=Brumimicrobium aurantiacum TaxID=1737063 RepID=A0A3E1EXI4_9FLAO|nr:alkaline phosphatase family protein [Brumimicrobium aurantiacum]RFC54248.1 alkaline phosphatase family protein [Brumimicrobium aurantiacum]